jgi:hypothetical protein
MVRHSKRNTAARHTLFINEADASFWLAANCLLDEDDKDEQKDLASLVPHLQATSIGIEEESIATYEIPVRRKGSRPFSRQLPPLPLDVPVEPVPFLSPRRAPPTPKSTRSAQKPGRPLTKSPDYPLPPLPSVPRESSIELQPAISLAKHLPASIPTPTPVPPPKAGLSELSASSSSSLAYLASPTSSNSIASVKPSYLPQSPSSPTLNKAILSSFPPPPQDIKDLPRQVPSKQLASPRRQSRHVRLAELGEKLPAHIPKGSILQTHSGNFVSPDRQHASKIPVTPSRVVGAKESVRQVNQATQDYSTLRSGSPVNTSRSKLLISTVRSHSRDTSSPSRIGRSPPLSAMRMYQKDYATKSHHRPTSSKSSNYSSDSYQSSNGSYFTPATSVDSITTTPSRTKLQVKGAPFMVSSRRTRDPTCGVSCPHCSLSLPLLRAPSQKESKMRTKANDQPPPFVGSWHQCSHTPSRQTTPSLIYFYASRHHHRMKRITIGLKNHQLGAPCNSIVSTSERQVYLCC